MEIVPFNREKHTELLVSWFVSRNCYFEGLEDTLPAIGVVAYQGKQPVAAAFLRQMEGFYGMFDGLISNPEASSKDRNAALDAVIDSVLKSAKSLEIKVLMAWSKDENTIIRAVSHGFVESPHHALLATSPTSRSDI